VIQTELSEVHQTKAVWRRFALPVSERPLLLITIDILILLVAGYLAFWIASLI
jgi:hypothetical protein